jgi:hypothetical protein
MPKDHWKKARDVDHAKRAKLERAVGSPPSYDYVWDADIDAEAEPSAEISRVPAIRKSVARTKVLLWLELLNSSGLDAKIAQKMLDRISSNDVKAIPVLLNALGYKASIVRSAAVEVLVRIGKHAIHPILERLLVAKGTEQACLVTCLVRIGEPAWTILLRDILEHVDATSQTTTSIASQHKWYWDLINSNSPNERQVARIALVNAGANAIPFLLDCLEHEPLESGLLAISILGELGKAALQTMPMLIEITKNADDERVRAVVSKAWNAIRQDVLGSPKTSAVSISLPLSSRQKDLRTVGSHVTLKQDEISTMQMKLLNILKQVQQEA